MRRSAALVAVSAVLLATCARPPAAAPVKNLVLMVPDGASFPLVTLSRWVKGSPLALDGMLVGAVHAAATDSVITDSAAAATAYATGHTTENRFLGLAPCTPANAAVRPPATGLPCGTPLATLLEAAQLAGLRTGIVATSSVSHATPAGFAAHVENRYAYDDIMEQLVHQDLDVVLGGGRNHLLPQGAGGTRGDGEDLLAVLRGRGVEVVETAAELAAASAERVWGAFAPGHLEPALDRERRAPQQPTLAAMTRRALELLAPSPRGFVLVVEGSQIDWGLHDNDPGYAVSEMLAFDDAVRAAVEWAGRDGSTLVLAFADHVTGGPSLGNVRTDEIWSRTSIADTVDPIRRMRATADAIAAGLGDDPGAAEIAAAVAEWWGIDLADAETARIVALRAAGRPLAEAIGRVVSEGHTVVGWTTFEHAGDDVPLWAFGPGRPAGLFANTEIARTAAAVLGLDLDAARPALFVDAAAAFPGATVEHPDGDDPVLRVGDCRVAANQDLVRCAGLDAPVAVDGVAVHLPIGDRFYLSRAAVTVIERVRSGLPVE